MADLKISQLNSGDPAQTSDQIPINRGGANFRITAGSISALPPTTALANEAIFVNAAGTSLDGDSGFTYAATTGQLSLTGKTLTASAPVVNLAQTWNNAAISFTSALLNVTNTASAATSRLLDLQVGGTSVFNVTPSTTNPGLTVTNASAATLFSVSNTTIIGTRTVQLTPSANTSALTASSYSLSGSNAQSLVDLAGTWNTTGTPTAIKLNVTDTASNAASNLLDLQVGGSSKFKIGKDGGIVFIGDSGLVANGNVRIWSSSGASVIIRNSTNTGNLISIDATGTLIFGADLTLSRKAAASLQFGGADAAAPVAQTIGPQSVVAGTSNTAGANFTIRGSQGTGTGAGGSIILQTAAAGASGTAQNALTTALTITSAQKAEFASSIKTGAPAGGTAAEWKLGAVAVVSPTAPDRTIEVDIGGTIYYLHAKTTNN